MSSQVQYLNPDGLNKNPAFTNVITVTGNVKTVYVGGQDSINAAREIVGKGDLKVQAAQVMQNMEIALAAAGAGFEHIVKCTIYIVQGQSLQAAFEASREYWGDSPNPPTVSVLFVAGLAHPDFLLEMDAIAVVPQ